MEGVFSKIMFDCSFLRISFIQCLMTFAFSWNSSLCKIN